MHARWLVKADGLFDAPHGVAEGGGVVDDEQRVEGVEQREADAALQLRCDVKRLSPNGLVRSGAGSDTGK